MRQTFEALAVFKKDDEGYYQVFSPKVNPLKAKVDLIDKE